MTVPVDVRPPGTVVGSSVTLTTVGAVTVSVSVADMPFRVPVITAFTGAATPTVVTVNCALVAPSTIVTVAGTPAFELLLESATGTPPTGAADDSVTVPLLDVPPGTETGRTVRPVSCGAVTVSVPVAVRAPMVPVIVAEVLDATAAVSALKVTSVAPAGTVIDAGTVTAVLLLDSATCSPVLGAGPESEIVPVEDTPPTTLAGLNEIVVAIGLSTVSEPVADVPKLEPVIVTTVSRLTVDVWIANTAVV